jgi:predicted trehalose synthase
MLRSFDYAVATARGIGPAPPATGMPEGDEAPADFAARTERRADASLLREAFLDGYRQRTRGAAFLPTDDAAITAWLDFFELDKALYEIKYEVNNRPDWVAIPLTGMRRILERCDA